MINRYFIKLSFRGTNYHGWQAQENSNSVQMVLNEAMTIILKEEITTTGAGRTDTGVHAKEFFAHFDTIYELDEKKRKELILHLNGYLPRDIGVHEIFQVKSDSHARFSAISRTYQYIIAQTKDPFLFDFAYYYSVPLDIERMNEGAAIIKSYKDFTSFAKLRSESKTNFCLITDIFWEKKGDVVLFTITANRFLRNMVRAIVGTLIDIGRKKIQLSDLERIILSRNRSAAGYSVPACGLFLTSIIYPDDIIMAY